MTDRVSGFVVVLDKDVRIDDIEPTINAIKQIKGVVSVSPHIAEPGNFIHGERIKTEIAQKLSGFIKAELLA